MTARIMGGDPYITPDERDEEILAKRQAMLDERTEIKQGDRVIFADGVERWVSHVWEAYDHPTDGYPTSVQTSAAGSFYLGDGYCSMSGGLFTGVPADTLTRTDDTRQLGVWFFHHDWHQAHSAVHAQIDVPVWTCTLPSTHTH